MPAPAINFNTLKQIWPFVAVIVTMTFSYASTNANNDNRANNLEQKLDTIIKNQELDHTQVMLLGQDITLLKIEQSGHEIRLKQIETLASPWLSRANQ